MAGELVRSPGGKLTTAGFLAVGHAKKAAKKTAKKAAKKTAKKAAKKSAKHAGEPHGGDELRVYGHLGRVASIRGYIADEKLAALADEVISLARAADSVKGKAELLRCAEHVLFAGLQIGREHPVSMHPRLEEEIVHEYRKLMDKVEEQGLNGQFQPLGRKLSSAAEAAYHSDRMASALELARAAEAWANSLA